MDVARNIDQANRSRKMRGWLIAAAIVFGGGVGVHVLWQIQEGKRAVDAANDDVKRNIGTYLPQAFSAWSDTVRGDQLLAPDVVYSGKSSAILAIVGEEEDTVLGGHQMVWHVLAKSKAGTYFALKYYLCDDCDVDAKHLKANRIYTSTQSGDFQLLTTDQAKDWLFRAGLRKKYKQEFGVEPPPAEMQG
ncbi:hypothetical protein [Burkholderia multivorans]|uniref:hypothetical protein n=1 Tax=Burkholderia multivorans TaxID=87883 RepID=UPI00158E1854|nr:hypothetical protein [Burkholderia multivorans]MDN8102569.1 hypothetical protein [Burkholderia multivorans]